MVAGVSGYLQLVMELGDQKLKEKGYVQKSLDILKSISHLIENVKKIQQAESSDDPYGIMDLGRMLKDIVEELKDQPLRDVSINYRPCLNMMVNASELLKDVFINIIGNAIKHSFGPVIIDIQLDKVLEDGKEYYRTSIEDNGPGIPDDTKDKLFSEI